MRTCLVILSSLLSLMGFGQIESAGNFLDFALSDQHNKASIMGSDWIQMDENIEGDTYWRFYNGEKYLLTLKEKVDYEIGAKYIISQVTINSEKVFNDWISEWKNEGIKIVNDPSSSNKWAVMDEDFYGIYLEKRQIKDLWIYEISVFIESALPTSHQETNLNPSVETDKKDSTIWVNELPEDKNRSGGIGVQADPIANDKRQIITPLDTVGLMVDEKCKIEFQIMIDHSGKVFNPQLREYIEYVDESTLSKKENKKRSKLKTQLIEDLSNRIKYKMKFEAGNKFQRNYLLTIEINIDPLNYTVSYRPL